MSPKPRVSSDRRLRYNMRGRGLLLTVLAAVVVIAVTATVASMRLDVRPRPVGAPPMHMPSPVKSELPRLESGTWASTPPDASPSSCKQPSLQGAAGAWIVSYLDDNSKKQDLVSKQAKGLSLLDFSWASVSSPTDLAQTDSFDPALDTELTTASQSSPCGLRFVTLSDNKPGMSHTADVRMIARILISTTVRSEHVKAVAQMMADQPLATGLTLDYENGLPKNLTDLATVEKVAGWHGLSLDAAVNRLTGDYSELVREIAAAMHQQHRLLRLEALVRSSDDVDVATSDIAPYLLDYGTLAQYADQIVLKAYDFHYPTGNPGAISPFTNVAQVLTYVHTYDVPWSKLAIAVPLYAYDWTVNSKGNIAVAADGAPVAATTLTATQVAGDKKKWRLVKTESGETEYSYTQGKQKHIVWDASSGIKAEMTWLQRNYPQIGIVTWKIGNSDPSGSALTIKALNG